MIPKFRAFMRLDKAIVDVKNLEWIHDSLWVITQGRTFNSNKVGVDCDLMQSTGLKDSNGKEIYEGDILTDWMKRSMKVVWKNQSWMMESLTETNFNIASLHEWFVFSNIQSDLTIIGNIYENPEMVGGR